MKAIYRFAPAIFALFIGASLQAQVINATQTDEIILDNGAAGKADPNDKIRYKVNIQNTSGPAGAGVKLNVVPDPRTTLLPATFRSSPVAINDSYACTGNVGIIVPAASGLLANDFDDSPGTLTATAGTFSTTGGGSIIIASDGGFTYTPPAGLTGGGTDTYNYTLNDGNGIGGAVPSTDVATVTFTVSNLIWFIDNGAAAGDGRLGSPFNSLASFNAGSTAAGDVVYLEHTGTDYTGGIVLQNSERLFGEGHTGGANLANVLPFALAPNSKILPNISGSRPVVTNAGGAGIQLASGNILRGVNVGNCSGFAIDDNGSVGALTVSELLINNTTGGGFRADNGGSTIDVTIGSIVASGGTNGVILSSITGSFTVSGAGTFSGQSGDIISLSQIGAGSTISFGATTMTPTGSNQGVEIQNASGTITFAASSSISNSGAEEFFVNQGNASITYNGTINSTAGGMVGISNHTGGVIDLTGNLTQNATATGINLSGNTGGTIRFSGASKSLTCSSANAVNLASNTGATIEFTNGGLVVSTTSGICFNATGGGTVTVTGSNNTLTSTTGTALNIANTNIGSANVIFKSISANGASNGIVLNTTGGSGGLQVTGTGSGNGTGGTIQNISSRGVSATSTSNLSLKNITFTNANTTDAAGCLASNNSTCNAAIYANTVTNLEMDNVDIDGAAQQGVNLREVNGFKLNNSTLVNCGLGGQTEESNLYAQNISGTCEIVNSSLTVPAERAAVFYNTSKTMALTVSGSTFGMNQTQPLGADGLEINSYGSSNTTIDITNCTFVQPKTNGLQVITEGTSFSSVDVSGSTFDPGPGLAAAIDLVTNVSGDMDFNIVNNPLIKSKGINAVNIFAFAGSKFEGRVNNNTINVGAGSGSGSGVRVNAQGNLNSVIEIKNNTITGADDYGITNLASQGSGRLDVTVTSNVISVSNLGFYGIHTAAGTSGSTFTNKVCANVANNNTNGVPIPNAIGNYQARAATASHEIMLQGTGGSTAVIWNNNSNVPINPPAIISQSGTGVFTFGATCTIPANPN